MLGRENAVRKAGRPLRPRVSLVHVAALAAHEVEHLLRVGDAVHRAVFGVLRDERTVLGTVHEPVHRLGKDERPMSAEVHVGFLGRNQQELRIGLRPKRAEVRVEFLETHIREIARVTIAVEVHDHRGIDAHRFQHRLERRRPIESIRQRLNRVGKMPVRAQGLVAVERRKRSPLVYRMTCASAASGAAAERRKNTPIR